MIPWLEDRPDFPPIECALGEPNGLLAAGGELNADWLLTAYGQGVFPWFADGDPILWWSPDPRMVLFPREIKISRSLRKVLNSQRFSVRSDSAFTRVLQECAAPREGAQGTWILPSMQAAYTELFEAGHAHSVEVWQGDELVGGLYGVAQGRLFFGESMFHRQTDASKVAFAHLARRLDQAGFLLIDCQMHTSHLASLGAREISRAHFIEHLAASQQSTALMWPWLDQAAPDAAIDWRT